MGTTTAKNIIHFSKYPRGEIMVHEVGEDTQQLPETSSIYWVGDGMCIDCIINGANKIGKANHLGGATKCEKVKKRDEWVKYLIDKAGKLAKKIDVI